jgi:hypothetical protein
MADFRPGDLPTIPFPEPTIESLLAVCTALKQAVEVNMGIRGDRPLAHVFVAGQAPRAQNIGDIWINPYPSAMLSYWTGANWQVFAVTRADGSLHSS